MKNVIGIFEAPAYEAGKPLRAADRVVFEAWNSEEAGYFDLIAPLFEDFAQRDAGIGLHSINVLIVFSGADLQQAIQRINEMIGESHRRPIEWSHHLGTFKEPGQPEREVHVSLYTRRLIAVLRRLRAMFSEAHSKRYCVVFGNGVARIALLGERLPPETEIYS